jgi:hypothetical protein
MLARSPKMGLVQTQVTPLNFVRMHRARGSPVGWVQPTIVHRVTSVGLHPPHALRTIGGVTLPSPRSNHARKGRNRKARGASPENGASPESGASPEF